MFRVEGLELNFYEQFQKGVPFLRNPTEGQGPSTTVIWRTIHIRPELTIAHPEGTLTGIFGGLL